MAVAGAALTVTTPIKQHSVSARYEIQESPAEARVTRDSSACIKTPDNNSKLIDATSRLPIGG